MDPAAQTMTPEERLAADLCAECGTPLSAIDTTHHSLQHWPQFLRPDGTNAEALRRQQLMADYASSHKAAEAHRSTTTPPPKPSGSGFTKGV